MRIFTRDEIYMLTVPGNNYFHPTVRKTLLDILNKHPHVQEIYVGSADYKTHAALVGAAHYEPHNRIVPNPGYALYYKATSGKYGHAREIRVSAPED